MRKYLAAVILIAAVAAAAVFFLLPGGIRPAEKQEIASSGDKAGDLYARAAGSLEKGDEEQAISILESLANEYKSSVYWEKALRDLSSIHIQRGDYAKGQFYLKQLYGPGQEQVRQEAPQVSQVPETIAEKEQGPVRTVSFDDISVQDQKEEALQPKAAEIGFSGFDRTSLPSNTSLTDDENVIVYVVQQGDSLYKISRKFNTTVESMKKMNGLYSDTIRAGQKLKADISTYSVHVDKSDNILVLKKNGLPYKTYTVSTGKNNSTPVGVFKIVDKMVEPAWTKPGVGIVVPGDEQYELGTRWMPIDVPGYGIHGTNDESSIGAQVTAGCVRMKNSDVEELYDIVTRGTEVEIVD